MASSVTSSYVSTISQDKRLTSKQSNSFIQVQGNEDPHSVFVEVMADKHSRVLLQNFLKDKFCDYLITFYELVKEYEAATDDLTRQSLSHDITKRYIKVGAMKQVNLSEDERKEVMTQLNISPLPKDAFDVALKKVSFLIEAEMFWEFKRTQEYRNWVKQKRNKDTMNAAASLNNKNVEVKSSGGCACVIM